MTTVTMVDYTDAVESIRMADLILDRVSSLTPFEKPIEPVESRTTDGTCSYGT